jgi:hypothetical protein
VEEKMDSNKVMFLDGFVKSSRARLAVLEE